MLYELEKKSKPNGPSCFDSYLEFQDANLLIEFYFIQYMIWPGFEGRCAPPPNIFAPPLKSHAPPLGKVVCATEYYTEVHLHCF
jgi:hypothetical protein